MTIRSNYYCNLCGAWGIGKTKLIGIYYFCNEIQLRPYKTTNNHICIDCLRKIKSIKDEEIEKYE